MNKRFCLLGSSSIVAALLLCSAAQAAQPPRVASADGLCTVTVNVPPPPPGPVPDFAVIFGRPNPQAERPVMEKLRDDLYVIKNAQNDLSQILQFGGNVTVYVTDEGVILFDSKNEQMHDDIVAKVRSVTDKPIKYVVVTHNHADHSSGVAKLIQDGATVIMSRDDGHAMTTAGPGARTPQVMYVHDGSVALGGKEVQLTEHCGHTRGDTVAYLPAARVVVAGDLVTTPDSIPTIVSYDDGGNWTDMGKALDKIAAMDFEFLVAGHGPVLTKPQFLAYRERVTRIRDRARALVREGKNREEFTQTLMREFNYGTGPALMNIGGMMAELR